MSAAVFLASALFGVLNKPEIIGADLVFLMVIAIIIWARWSRRR
jgi:hypothetical protein